MKSASSLMGVAVMCLAAMLLPSTILSAHAQGAVTFTPATTFAIPKNNGVICFSVEGSCSSASLNNNVWDFTSFFLKTTKGYQPNTNQGNGNFSVSAQDCNVTVLCFESVNRFPPVPGRLNYSVAGVGSQAFNAYYGTSCGMIVEWTVYIDGENRSHGDGWMVGSDGWLNVTGARFSVGIYHQYIDPITAKVQEFKAQGLNDTQIMDELAKLGMEWNPETGATAIGEPSTPEEMEHNPIPTIIKPSPISSPAPLSAKTEAPSDSALTPNNYQACYPAPIWNSPSFYFLMLLATVTGIAVASVHASRSRKSSQSNKEKH